MWFWLCKVAMYVWPFKIIMLCCIGPWIQAVVFPYKCILFHTHLSVHVCLCLWGCLHQKLVDRLKTIVDGRMTELDELKKIIEERDREIERLKLIIQEKEREIQRLNQDNFRDELRRWKYTSWHTCLLWCPCAQKVQACLCVHDLVYKHAFWFLSLVYCVFYFPLLWSPRPKIAGILLCAWFSLQNVFWLHTLFYSLFIVLFCEARAQKVQVCLLLAWFR